MLSALQLDRSRLHFRYPSTKPSCVCFLSFGDYYLFLYFPRGGVSVCVCVLGSSGVSAMCALILKFFLFSPLHHSLIALPLPQAPLPSMRNRILHDHGRQLGRRISGFPRGGTTWGPLALFWCLTFPTARPPCAAGSLTGFDHFAKRSFLG
jgi:hypothetical protein